MRRGFTGAGLDHRKTCQFIEESGASEQLQEPDVQSAESRLLSGLFSVLPFTDLQLQKYFGSSIADCIAETLYANEKFFLSVHNQ